MEAELRGDVGADEGVGGARVDEGDQICARHTYAELQGVNRGDPSQCMEGDTDRVRNIGRNFAIYPIYRVYRWGPIFFLSAEIDLMNIFYTKK